MRGELKKILFFFWRSGTLFATLPAMEVIRKLIANNSTASRRGLSKLLCEAWNWRQPNGALRDMVCRSLMLELHRAGLIELPPVRWVNPNPLAERRKPAPVEIDAAPLRVPLSEIRPLEFRQVRRSGDVSRLVLRGP